MKNKNPKIDEKKYPKELSSLIEHINKINSGDKEEEKKFLEKLK